jgi:type II secretory pathway component PulF
VRKKISADIHKHRTSKNEHIPSNQPRSRFLFLKKKKKTYEDELESFALFVRMFGFLIRDGYTPDVAISMLVKSTKGELGEALRLSIGQLQRGIPISKAFKDTHYFPQDFCQVVAVGESRGLLGEALDLYAGYVENVLQMKKKFTSALSYPVLLLSFILVMTVIIIFLVVPKFATLLEQMNVDMSTSANNFSQFCLRSTLSLIISGFPLSVVCVLGLVFYLLFGKGKQQIFKALHLFPKIKNVNNKLNWAQWLMLGAICLKSGMLLNPMLDILSGLSLPKELRMVKKSFWHFPFSRSRNENVSPYAVLQKNVAAGQPLSAEMDKLACS